MFVPMVILPLPSIGVTSGEDLLSDGSRGDLWLRGILVIELRSNLVAWGQMDHEAGWLVRRCDVGLTLVWF